ncbi:YfhO family protein [Streptacidiphilus jiangxiensis]|uniref:Membrane protein YfhO n=1 Tax=Streptacidiphilus jiangxiensis TaxID=235985 RepID=A0A1H7XTA8_STRJI|nr:YfhO family protein [Streptacidiphilus jiangxiensis]SEM36229.1 membrane protein YfhO [Streptacidiphilus jiangxiensis]
MRSIKAASLSAVLSMAAYCAGLAMYGTYPFGSHSRAMNDLRNQYVPFHVALWDLLHGVGHNSLFFNWNSSYGVGFLGEYFTYLASPFSLLVGLFPRQQADFPVFLVSLLSMGLAAAMMTIFLGRLAPGSGWLRALLSVGYALCGWSVIDGSVVPMWMFGLAALPMLCIAADWCLQGRRWVAGALVVGLCWYANFYSAAMATLGAALVLILRLALDPDLDLRGRLRVLWRAASMVVVGLLLAAPAILVSGLASKDAQPSESYVISVGVGPLDYLAKFLPGVNPVVNAPNVFVGVLVLLLVLVLPFQRRLPVRVRVAWLALIVLTALSFTIHATALVWQGFAIPHGVPWRETFVLSGFMVMAAWLALANRPDRRALLGGGGLLALLALVTVGTGTANWLSWTLLGVGGVLALGALVLLGREGLSPSRRRLVCGLMTAGVFVGATLGIYNVTNLQGDRPAYTGPRTTMNSVTASGYEAIKAANAWPNQRFDVGSEVFVTDNDPILMDADGGSFYSSYIPAPTATALQQLGLPWAMAGRHIIAPADPVSQALLSVGRTLTPTGAGSGQVTAKPAPVAPVPLVTVHSGDGTDTHGAPAGTVWANQQALLGASVYQVPTLHRTDAGGALVPSAGGVGGDQAWPVAAQSTTSFGFECRAGSAAFLYAPYFGGTVTSFGKARTLNGAYPVLSSGVRFLGDVPADGRATVEVTTTRGGQQIPQYAVGCLSLPALKAATAASAQTAPTVVHAQGAHLDASFPAGTTGTAVVATTDVKGWTCSVNGGAAKTPSSYAGMLAVPLAAASGGGAEHLSCDYTPPGLAPGLAGTGAGTLALAAVLVVAWRRRRTPADAR